MEDQTKVEDQSSAVGEVEVDVSTLTRRLDHMVPDIA